MGYNNPRVPMRQVLDATTVHSESVGAEFYAVVIDPDTQKPVEKIMICRLDPGEVMELALERKTLFEDHE